MRMLLVLGSMFALLAGSRLSSTVADEPITKSPGLTVKLGKIPNVKLTPRIKAGQAQIKRIKELIADLAKLDSADIGLSAIMNGHDFAPVPCQSQISSILASNHRVKQSQIFRDLVELGPAALPYLLDALDDKTPTNIIVKHEGDFGGMWYGGELGSINPANPAEAAVYKSRSGEGGRGSNIKSHTVTIGDVCFVVVGQIVGRGYQAVRYQPTACIVVNSPTQDAKLCANVRSMWTSKDPARKLFDSLLTDYSTEGPGEGDELGYAWELANLCQCGAALRLLYYFPQECAALIAERLDKLDVSATKDVDDLTRQFLFNRVRADEFIKGVSWSKEPVVRTALIAVFKRAGDQRDMLAALPAIDDVNLVHERLEPLVAKLPPDDSPYHQGHVLLSAFVRQTPATTKPILQKYLRNACTERCLTACVVLREVEVAWETDVLGPLLEDSRMTQWTYPVNPEEKKGPRLPKRVCDVAAETLAQKHSELKFTFAGGHADLDKQIAVIREQLNRKH
ncbi:MAG: hypothetical protein JWO38_7985 [Gemmataceae bacterium]|nr:hypothetical protein [Gemmataceae bacterium]